MNYKILKDSDGNFSVIESSTQLTIKKFGKYVGDAVELQYKLNRGSGFAGFTPPFFLNEEKIRIK